MYHEAMKIVSYDMYVRLYGDAGGDPQDPARSNPQLERVSEIGERRASEFGERSKMLLCNTRSTTRDSHPTNNIPASDFGPLATKDGLK
jgi:hypothetical protein